MTNNNPNQMDIDLPPIQDTSLFDLLSSESLGPRIISMIPGKEWQRKRNKKAVLYALWHPGSHLVPQYKKLLFKDPWNKPSTGPRSPYFQESIKETAAWNKNK